MENIGYLLADNSRLARSEFDRQVREAGVTGPQARLLLTLDRAPGENQGFYADRLEVKPITLCRMVDRLEEAGLVERRADPADRRGRRLHLTDRSTQMIAKLESRLAAMMEEMLAGLDQAEREDFARMLRVIGSNLAARRELAEVANG